MVGHEQGALGGREVLGGLGGRSQHQGGCGDCGGALRINSISSQGSRMLGVHIPRKACPACREQGLKWYEEGDHSRFNHIFLQDRPTDSYLEK